MSDLPQSSSQVPPPPRYCGKCGIRFPAPDATFCTACGTRWFSSVRLDTIPTLLQTVGDVERWRRDGVIDPQTYDALIANLEERLVRLRPPAPPMASVAASPAPSPASPAPAVAPSMPVTPVMPQRPAAPAMAPPPNRPPGVDLAAWAAQRQADLLLYLGAFLLVVAAILFTENRGSAVPPELRAVLLGAYTLTFIASGLLLRRWERVREAGPVFLALGALLLPLNFVLAYTGLLRDEGIPRDWVWLLGSVTSMVLYGALYFGRHGRGYRYLAGFAAVNAWEALFAVLNAPNEWLPAWHMLLALLIVGGATRARAFRKGLLASAAGVAGLALFGAHLAAGVSEDVPAQLPATYVLLTAGLVLAGRSTGWSALLPAAASSTTGAVVASMWAAGLDDAWLWYPPPLLGALALASRPYWVRRSSGLARFGWLFAGAWGATPALMGAGFEAWHGVALFGLAATVLATVALLDREFPLAVWFEVRVTDEQTPLRERVGFAWVSYALGLQSLAYANRAFEVTRPDVAWSYLAAASAVGLVLAFVLARWPRSATAALASLLPPFLLAVALAMQPWDRYPGHDAIILGVAGAELLLCAALARSWSVSLLGAALGAGALQAGWEQREWPAWTLALTYEAIGSALLVATARWRSYDTAGRGAGSVFAVLMLPLGMLSAAFAVAVIALDDPRSPLEVFDTPAYRVLTGLVAAAALQFFYEAARLRLPSMSVPGSLCAGFAIAMLWPALDWPAWTLALTYEAIGGALLLGTARWRVYRPASEAERSRLVATLVPLGGSLGAALLVSLAAVGDRLGGSGFYDTPEYWTLTGLVSVGAAMCLSEAWRLRAPDVTVAAGVLAGLAIAIAWPGLRFDVLWLPAAYEVVGTAVLLDRARRGARGGIAALWVWGYIATALLIAVGNLPDSARMSVVVESPEYRLLVGLVFLGAAQLGFEGARLRAPLTPVLASGVALLGVLMAIAMAQPANVQAYTAPTAAYLFALGLLGGRRPIAFREDLYAHEALLAAAVLVLVLPQAEQSFEPGGARWGFALLLEGGAMLAVGLLLYERWLSVGGVLSISGVGLRWLIDTGRALPFWVTLGLVGLALLGLGVLLLFQREWWAGARSSVAMWWRGQPDAAVEE